MAPPITNRSEAVAAEMSGHTIGTHLQFYVRPVRGAKPHAARLGGLLALHQ